MSNNTLKSFKSILNVTGSQCKDLRTGVICSDSVSSQNRGSSVLDEMQLSNAGYTPQDNRLILGRFLPF